MRHREVCACGAEIEIEDDDGMSLRQEIHNWRQAHPCGGMDGWRKSERSTTDARLDFGFLPDVTRPVEAM